MQSQVGFAWFTYLPRYTDFNIAHRALLSRNNIHRDISPNNPLGPGDAEAGERGVVIDLDVALKSTGASSQTVVDVKVVSSACRNSLFPD